MDRKVTVLTLSSRVTATVPLISLGEGKMQLKSSLTCNEGKREKTKGIQNVQLCQAGATLCYFGSVC